MEETTTVPRKTYRTTHLGNKEALVIKMEMYLSTVGEGEKHRADRVTNREYSPRFQLRQVKDFEEGQCTTFLRLRCSSRNGSCVERVDFF